MTYSGQPTACGTKATFACKVNYNYVSGDQIRTCACLATALLSTYDGTDYKCSASGITKYNSVIVGLYEPTYNVCGQVVSVTRLVSIAYSYRDPKFDSWVLPIKYLDPITQLCCNMATIQLKLP